jgi:hypothetical protein
MNRHKKLNTKKADKEGGRIVKASISVSWRRITQEAI